LHFHRLLTFFSYLVLEAVVWTEATFQAEPQDSLIFFDILWYSLHLDPVDVTGLSAQCFNLLQLASTAWALWCHRLHRFHRPPE
jgi:hypothetical protein